MGGYLVQEQRLDVKTEGLLLSYRAVAKLEILTGVGGREQTPFDKVGLKLKQKRDFWYNFTYFFQKRWGRGVARYIFNIYLNGKTFVDQR